MYNTQNRITIIAMKNLIILLVLFLGAQVSNAQVNYKKSPAKFGVKISVGKLMAGQEATYVGNPFDFINHEVMFEGANAVKNIGLFYQQKFGYLFLRADLGYSQFSQKYNVKSYVQVANPVTFATERFQFIDFQVMGGLNIGSKFRVGAGPVAHILVNQKSELGFISGFETRNRNITYGFIGGVGFDSGRLHLDARYEVGFRNVGDHLYYVNRMARSEEKANILSFTIGVDF